MTETDTHTIVGTCGEISERNGWTSFAISVPGKQYPVKLSTKLPALIEQGRAVGDQVATWRYKETESEKINENTGKPFVNRYFESVTPGAQAAPTDQPAAAAPASGSSPASQSGKYPSLAGGDRERSIVRQTCIKAAAELYMGRGEPAVDDPDAPDYALDVIRAAGRFENWILRDLVNPDEEVPF